MASAAFPDSLPLEFGLASQRNDYTFEPTQLSQPMFSQTQGTQYNSQVEPRRKYWAVLIPTNAAHSILKIPWSRPVLQIGRGPQPMSKNHVVLQEKRVSNVHCRITLGLQGVNGSGTSYASVQAWKDGEGEPEVWIEDLKSSNGTFVNGERVNPRRLLQHGDEVSLGHASTLENHDVRYIYRSVGHKGVRYGGSKGGVEMVGQVYERYQLLDRLGKGTFAEVRKAVDIETGDLRAVKQIVKHRFAGDQKTLNLFQRETEITHSLEHDNICRLIEWFEDPQHICLVLEYIDGGDLLDYIMKYPSEDGRGLPEDHAASFALQICHAMAYTHAMGITHRDLKPENILLTRETPDTPAMIKIADYGLAKMVDDRTMLKSLVGTPQYLAPEVVMQTKQKPGYENVVDSWSVGIIVFSMMTKSLPFDEDDQMGVAERVKSRFKQEPDLGMLESIGISAAGIDFIARLLAKNPSQRMTMQQALQHDWLAAPISSQKSDTPPAALGGDSMWSIESFDDVDSVADLSDDGMQLEEQWERPMTASGTNLEGLSGNPSALSGASDESFSQPLQNLHLATPASPSRAGNFLRSSSSPIFVVPESVPDQTNNIRQSSSPPSPPLTDERMDADLTPAAAASAPPTPPAANGHAAEDSLPTPSDGANPHKRKLLTPGAPNGANGFFSSGSLSPPPDGAGLSTPGTVTAPAVNTPTSARTPDTQPTSTRSKGKTRSATKRAVRTVSPSAAPTTRRTRSQARARKSIRLV